jgi:ABC-type nitrate/sulfonate/bicarbonate transport system substrate-binding protein
MVNHSRRQWLRHVAPYVPFALAACSPDRSSDLESRTLRISVFPSIINGGLFLAQEKRLFSLEGITVRFVTFKNTSQTVPLLAGGQLEAAASGMSSALLNAVAQGATLRIVATIGAADALCGNGGSLYARPGEYEKGPAGIRKLAGRRIAISAVGGLGEFFLDTLLQGSGLTSRDCTLLQLPQAEGIAALLGQKVDAIVYAQLDKEVASLSGGMVPLRHVDEIYPGLQFNFIIFGSGLLRNEVETGRKLLRAVFQGNGRYLDGETPRFLRDFIDSNRLNRDVTLGACRGGVVRTGAMDPAHIQYFIDWAVQKNYCPKPMSADTLMDRRFLDV